MSLPVESLFMRILPFPVPRIDPVTDETAHMLATVSTRVVGRFDQMKRLAYFPLTG
jgi:hypothetical protein